MLSQSEARKLYTQGDAAHDFDHVLRVARLAEAIALAEGADVSIVRTAAYLHDVPVQHQNGRMVRSAHHLAAADFARELLTARGVGNKTVDAVVHSIEAHRFRDQSITPRTLEAQCLYDADKLDSMGAIGIARAFAFAGAHDSRLWTESWSDAPADDAQPAGAEYTPVHEYVYKLSRLQATLYTATARRMGEARHAFMRTFFDRLDNEMMGADS
ncbi:MAG: HD domain-containing protein [Caldilineaceae bacterium]|nr:HD domain-containing protein [Caldilineaceae bacterium]